MAKAVQYGIPVLRRNHLKSRQMMSSHHNMTRRTLLYALPDETDTCFVHPVELRHLQRLPVEPDLAEVTHAFPRGTPVIRVNPRPQRTQHKVRVIYAYNLILIVAHILAEHPPPLQPIIHHVRIVVVFVVTGVDNQCL